MKNEVFHFEIRDALSEFARAFNDVVISRFNNERVMENKIPARLVYVPKKAVIYDLTNLAMNRTLPCIAFNLESVSRDEGRFFNKNHKYTFSNVGESSTTISTPVPINLSLSLTVLAKYQLDIDQIISNFAINANPYIIVSTPVPIIYDFSTAQELRSEILWSQDISIDRNTEMNPDSKDVILASTGFTYKTYLFPKHNTDKPIHKIYTNFAENTLDEYKISTIVTSGDPITKEITTTKINKS